MLPNCSSWSFRGICDRPWIMGIQVLSKCWTAFQQGIFSSVVHNHPGPILCLTPWVKAVKSFHGVLPSLVMVYLKTNLGGKSFSISEDIVKMIVALTLKIAKEYFHMILRLQMMYHHVMFIWSEILSGQTFTAAPNLHCDLDLEYSKATFLQDALSNQAYEHALSNQVGQKKISSSEHIIASHFIV